MDNSATVARRTDDLLWHVARLRTRQQPSVRNPDGYAAAIYQQLHEDRLRVERIVARHRTDTPMECLAAAVLGEPTAALAHYRTS